VTFRTRACAVAALAAALSILPHAAGAQVFGQYTGAGTLPVNGRMFGAYLETSDHVLGALGQLRLSFFPDLDFGIQAGLSRLSLASGDRTTVRFGIDVKTPVIHADAASPYTVAIGAAIGNETSDEYSVLTIAPEAVGSRDFPMGSSVVLTPYLGARIAIGRSSQNGRSDSNLSIPIFLGSELQITPATRLVLEVQLLPGNAAPDHFKAVAGANFPF
jgi:hypothetical protein